MVENERKIVTVTELNRQARTLLEKNISLVWVSGEISNLSQQSALGHVYFSLKDEGAQIKSALFRQYSSKLDFQLKNGMHVYVQGQVGLYEARGDYQLIAYNVEQAGVGILYKKLQQLKTKLQAEGLFDSKHKKPLPKLPKCIGIVTSPTGAAVRDVLIVLHRRFPSIPIIIYPTQVQGVDAAPQIVAALATANVRQECDVLIVGRGGGSLEDLWPFNEEIVARAIFASKIPTISAVGHEVDFTIADFVADVRAATPSAAAELAVPNVVEKLQTMTVLGRRALNLMQGKLQNTLLNLQVLSNRLQHPRQRLQQNMQRLDDLAQRLKLAVEHLYSNKQRGLEYVVAKLAHCNPTRPIQKLRLTNATLAKELHAAMQQQLKWWQHKLDALGKNLDAISPLATLHRGYAVVTKNAKVITGSQTLAVGDLIEVRLAHGELNCTVNQVNFFDNEQG